MAVFIGDYKNTSAARCALKINHAVRTSSIQQLLHNIPCRRIAFGKLLAWIPAAFLLRERVCVVQTIWYGLAQPRTTLRNSQGSMRRVSLVTLPAVCTKR
jgi:hypothetical protein